MPRKIKIAPSILAADFLHLGDEIRRVEEAGVDMLHLDVMDAHFVPNLSIGMPIVESVRRATKLHLDTHLMMDNPDKYLDAFAKAGVNGLTVHLEIFPEPDAILDRIGELGLTRGLSLNPDMPVERLKGKLSRVDRLLVMSVFPGFGGQKFIPETLDRIRRIRDMLDAEGRTDAEVEVDGGVGPGNAAELAAAGADLLVAGTAVFRADDPAAAVRGMRGE